jgi:hypothetical protein
VQHLLDAGSRRRAVVVGRTETGGTATDPRARRSSRGKARRSRSIWGAPSRRSSGPTATARRSSSTTAATRRCWCTKARNSRRPARCRRSTPTRIPRNGA